MAAHADGIDPVHLDPVAVRRAFHAAADLLSAIVDEWIEGDRKTSALMWGPSGRGGMNPTQGGFEIIVRDDYRAGLDRMRDTLRFELLPVMLPHCDPALRDRLLKLVTLIDIRGYFPDTEGDERARWRQPWPTTGLQTEFDELQPILRAAGDALAIASRAYPRQEASGARPESHEGDLPSRYREGVERRFLADRHRAAQVQAVLAQISGHAGDWLGSADIKAYGLAPSSVHSDFERHGTPAGKDGSGSTVRFSKRYLMGYVAERWSPRRKRTNGS